MSDYPDISEADFSPSTPSDPAPVAPEQVAAAPAQPVEYEISVNGRTIKAPIEHLTQWAQQGYDYNQRNAAFKQQLAEFENKQADFNNRYAHYEQIDAWAKANPDQWSNVLNGYQQLSADPTDQRLQALQQELADLKAFKSDLLTERQLAQQQEADKKLNSEVDTLRQQYSALDWDRPDAYGQTLEMRVLAHAQNNGINSFKAAFLDLNADAITAMAKANAIEEYKRQHSEKIKQGMAESTRSIKSIGEVDNYRQKSWAQIEAEAVAALTGG